MGVNSLPEMGTGALYLEPSAQLQFASHLLRCPVCESDYVHTGQSYTCQGNDNYEAWEGRGDCVYIDVNCESGHLFRIGIGFHKGQTFLFCQDFATERRKIALDDNRPKCGLLIPHYSNAPSYDRCHLAVERLEPDDSLLAVPLCRYDTSTEQAAGGFSLGKWKPYSDYIDEISKHGICRNCLRAASAIVGLPFLQGEVVGLEAKWGDPCADCGRAIHVGDYFHWTRSVKVMRCFVCITEHWQEIEERVSGFMVKFFRFGNDVGVQTDERDYAEFNRKFNEAWLRLAEDYPVKEDLPLVSERLLARKTQIDYKFGGYKADVIEQRLITSGEVMPAESACIMTVADNGKAVPMNVASNGHGKTKVKAAAVN